MKNKNEIIKTVIAYNTSKVAGEKAIRKKIIEAADMLKPFIPDEDFSEIVFKKIADAFQMGTIITEHKSRKESYPIVKKQIESIEEIPISKHSKLMSMLDDILDAIGNHDVVTFLDIVIDAKKTPENLAKIIDIILQEENRTGEDLFRAKRMAVGSLNDVLKKGINIDLSDPVKRAVVRYNNEARANKQFFTLAKPDRGVADFIVRAFSTLKEKGVDPLTIVIKKDIFDFYIIKEDLEEKTHAKIDEVIKRYNLDDPKTRKTVMEDLRRGIPSEDIVREIDTNEKFTIQSLMNSREENGGNDQGNGQKP